MFVAFFPLSPQNFFVWYWGLNLVPCAGALQLELHPYPFLLLVIIQIGICVFAQPASCCDPPNLPLPSSWDCRG
jgi:hypothetical protein